MKYIYIIALAFIFYNCNAQTLNLEQKGQYRPVPQGAYFKDINYYLDPFIGTYIYTKGSTSLKIKLLKKINVNSLYSEDIIYGGYEYIENGVVKANTLPENLPANTYGGSYYINGNTYLLNNSFPLCTTCVTNEKRLFITLKDPNSIYLRKLIIKRLMVGSQVQIKIKIDLGNTVYYSSTEPEPFFDFALPSGEYTLVKQP